MMIEGAAGEAARAMVEMSVHALKTQTWAGYKSYIAHCWWPVVRSLRTKARRRDAKGLLIRLKIETVKKA